MHGASMQSEGFSNFLLELIKLLWCADWLKLQVMSHKVLQTHLSYHFVP